ncbi:glycosyltransferase family 1 protein [Luteimonas yindakuii]|uniref:glycosyltransferase family 4 protein n=1 Tax=Luteimonas yindakuii TaxID=2565782 RepID=UPI0010A39070|nr:glycosyltransferase family 1 protein [Luteimonas yindakuii]QCO68010.1 glycosyltransferase family 1 protein [Luteimonas yindakuii]
MHYALVTETWPPEVNGVALTVRDLARGLWQRGHLTDVIRPRQHDDVEPVAQELLVPGARLPGYATLRFGLPAQRLLERRWRAQRPDAIYIATEGPLGWSALRAARSVGIPVATGLHTRFDLYMHDYGVGMLAPVAMGWMRRFHNAAAATLVPTRALHDELAGRGFRNPRHLPRAVDTLRFAPWRRDAALRARWGMHDDDLVVICVGRLAAEKNLPLAIAAFRHLQRSHPRARFVLVGDGPLRATLQREHPDFVFTGTRTGRSLAEHVASADLFLFPSRTETFGNVVLEAMASGVPVVAFDNGAAREHLEDGVHGRRVDDDAGFIHVTRELAGDAGTRRAMGLAAREATGTLSPAAVCADFDRILASLGHPHATTAALAAA